MRVFKIISFSVVILLITVLFAGALTVPAAAAPTDTMQFHYNAQHTGDYSPVAGSTPPNNQLKWSYATGGPVGPSPAVANGVVYFESDDSNIYALGTQTYPTTLTATISMTTAYVSQNFTIRGQLTAFGNPVPWETITLQRSLDNKNFTTLTAKQTNGTGACQFSRNETTVRTYYYRAIHTQVDSYANATSNIVKVTVKDPTTLTATASPTTVTVKQNFAIAGRLTSGSVGLPLQNVTLQRSTNNAKWTNVTKMKTAGTGNYAFTRNETTARTYYYRTYFGGSSTHGKTYSPTVTVFVGGKPTQLSLLSTKENPVVRAPYSLYGYLKAIGAPVPNQIIVLQQWSGSAWKNVATNKTNLRGYYAFPPRSQTTSGTYKYRTNFTGTKDYAANTSAALIEYVGVKQPTKLSLSSTSVNVSARQPYSLTGSLKTTSGLALANYAVTLQKNTTTGWSNVSSAHTNATGYYVFKRNETTLGPHVYRTHFNGQSAYTSATSNTITETVKTRTKISLTVTVSCGGFEQGGTATVKGQVLKVSGAPVPYAYVFLYEQRPGYETIWHLAMKGYADAQGNFTTSRPIESNTAYKYKVVFDETTNYFGASQEVFTWGC